MQLSGRVAIVTGAAGGLGSAIARRFAREGANVALCDIDETAATRLAQEIAAAGGACLALRCDVSSSAAVDAAFAAVDARFGTVHILVNNAAPVPDKPADTVCRERHYALLTQPLPRQSLAITREMSDEEWRRFWAVNVDGVFFCTRAALRRMEAQGYGRIVNIAAGANVLVNAIAPGGIGTPAFKRFVDEIGEERRNQLWQLVPLGRLGRPEEYAALAAHLASDECYLVGEVVNASGGLVI